MVGADRSRGDGISLSGRARSIQARWTSRPPQCILGFVTRPVAPTPDLMRFNERQLLGQLDGDWTTDDVVVDLTGAEPVVVINAPRKVTPPPADPGDTDDAITLPIRIALAKALEEI